MFGSEERIVTVVLTIQLQGLCRSNQRMNAVLEAVDACIFRANNEGVKMKAR